MITNTSTSLSTKQVLWGLVRVHWFPIMLVVALVVAWGSAGLEAVLNPRDLVKTGAIVGLFFIIGLGMKSAGLRQSLLNLRLQVAIQAGTFVVWPLLMWIVVRPFTDQLGMGLVTGFFALSVLPTSVASCIQFTDLLRGNTMGAFFGSFVSNVLGMFLSPLLLLMMLSSSAGAPKIDLSRAIFTLVLTTSLPLVLGRLASGMSILSAEGRRTKIKKSSPWLLLVISYLSFCKAFASVDDRGLTLVLVVPLALLVPAHLAGLALTYHGSKLIGFPRGDRIAVMFCTTEKTLTLGLATISACLAGQPELLGLACLPVAIYQVVQLVTGALLTAFWPSDSAD